jgi:hypothetical protein
MKKGKLCCTLHNLSNHVNLGGTIYVVKTITDNILLSDHYPISNTKETGDLQEILLMLEICYHSQKSLNPVK